MIRVEAIVIASGRTAVAPALSATCNVKLAETSSVGVPEIFPVLEFKLRPAGRVPAERLQRNGAVPPAVRGVCEYGAPRVPPGSDVVVRVRAEAIVIVNACDAVAWAASAS
jgi:hypothetical protein